MINDNINKLINKVEKLSLKEKLDLSSDEDLTIGIMNLISIEEHLYFTAQKTGKNDYIQILNEVREIRKELLKKIVKEYEGEVWCISKHLLASCMRLIEVGTKQLSLKNIDEANSMFEKAYTLWSLFWGVNMKLIEPGKILPSNIDEHKEVGTTLNIQTGFLSKLKVAVQKAVDCCIE